MECRQSIATQTAQEVNVEVRSSVTRRVQFTDTKEEYEPSSDCSSGDETFSGESCTFGPGHDDLSGETMSKRTRDIILSGSRLQSDQGTEFCQGSREISRTKQKTIMQNPSAQLITRSLSYLRLRRMGQKLHPIPTSQNSQFFLC